MREFSFRTTAQTEQYCREIIEVLVTTYGLPRSEALRLLNKGWRGQDFLWLGDLRCHKGGPEDWAKHIMAHWRD